MAGACLPAPARAEGVVPCRIPSPCSSRPTDPPGVPFYLFSPACVSQANDHHPCACSPRFVPAPPVMCQCLHVALTCGASSGSCLLCGQWLCHLTAGSPEYYQGGTWVNTPHFCQPIRGGTPRTWKTLCLIWVIGPCCSPLLAAKGKIVSLWGTS